MMTVTTQNNGVAVFSFDYLCIGKNFGPAEFIAISKNFHTVILTNLPRFPIESHDTTIRFIWLIDNLYERKCKLYLTS